MNKTNQTIGNFVKERRKLVGLTQIQMAEKSGVGLRFLRELESDKPTLRIDKVNQVLQMFGKQLGVIDMDRNNLS